MTEELSRFEPDWVSAPGESIADLLEEKGWTQSALAKRTGFTKKHINDLIAGRASISPDAALRLETALGSTAGFWLNRESQYREAISRRESVLELAGEKDWLAELPLKHMIDMDWINRAKGVAAQVRECLQFFGVASVDSWRKAYIQPLAAFRKSKRVKESPGALAAWLRQGERQAERFVAAPFDELGFHTALLKLRELTLEPDSKVFIPQLETMCAAVGVAVVFVPPPPQCPVFGATRWLSPDRALLQLSLRYKTNDHFWFTVFHEAGHILLHGKRMLFLEGVDAISDEQEDEANQFATETLIPSQFAEELASVKRSHDGVTALARRMGIAPGIIVGRLQKEGRIPWSNLNALKIRYRWSNDN